MSLRKFHNRTGEGLVEFGIAYGADLDEPRRPLIVLPGRLCLGLQSEIPRLCRREFVAEKKRNRLAAADRLAEFFISSANDACQHRDDRSFGVSIGLDDAGR